MFLVQPIVFGKSQDDTDNNIANDWTKLDSIFYNSWHVKYSLSLSLSELIISFLELYFI